MVIVLIIGVGVAIAGLVSGDYYLKLGSKEVEVPPMDSFGGLRGLTTPANLGRFIRQSKFFNLHIAVSLALLTIYFGAYMMALHAANVALVIPLMSLTEVVNTLVGKYFLHEPVNLLRWSGLALILIGIILMVIFGNIGVQA